MENVLQLSSMRIRDKGQINSPRKSEIEFFNNTKFREGHLKFIKAEILTYAECSEFL